LNLLVALDALLQERNVTRASERLQLSQPTVSSALARLRKLFGDPLPIRTGRQMQLTPRAESLVGPVGEALAIINAAIEQRPVFDPRHDPRTFTVMASDYASLVLARPVLASSVAKRAPGYDSLGFPTRGGCPTHPAPRRRVRHDLAACQRSWTIGFAIVGHVDEWDIYQTDEVAAWLTRTAGQRPEDRRPGR
jgi:hypothetical protein